MSQDAPAAAGAADTAPKKGKGKLFAIIGIVVALLLGGGGTWFFLSKKPAGEHAAEEHKAPPKKPTFTPMETFTVNLRGNDQERFLQTTISLETSDKVAEDAIKAQMPSIRNRVLLLLSSKDAAELLTREGKEKLATEIGTEIRKNLDGPAPNRGLEQVLFSHFVIQ
jgi:flagellar FliL protein